MTARGLFGLPGGLTPEEERAILTALERYFVGEDPRPWDWVLAGRMDSTGHGALQIKRLTDVAWRIAARAPFTRRALRPPIDGRGDAR